VNFAESKRDGLRFTVETGSLAGLPESHCIVLKFKKV
jgi:hypothetical protein